MKTITYTYNEEKLTNRDNLIAALTDSIDDGSAACECVIEHNVACPYYSSSDCLNVREGNEYGTAAYNTGCVRCKLSWLNRECNTFPSCDGRWEVEGKEWTKS